MRTILSIAAAVFAFAAVAHANIYQWEYINPADPNQGKRQSTTLAPDGAGVDAVPGADLTFRNLTMAYLVGADLTDANALYAYLPNADLSQANLADADFSSAALTDVNLSNANVRGTGLRSTRIALAQLYSTASFQAHDLSGINLSNNDLNGWSFAGQNLTNASFVGATLTDVDFSGAEIRGALFHKENGYLNAIIGTGITLAQLYSTASYQAHDLSGIGLAGSNLAGGMFAGQNLSNATFLNGRFPTDLSGANLSAANLTNVIFPAFVSGLTGVDLTAADIRGAELHLEYISGPITTNLIHADGHMDGLDLDADGLLIVRDYDGGGRYVPAHPPIPVTIDHHLTMGPGGTLRMVFEADDWDSTISFAPGIPVTLGGTLELTFADDLNLASQLGRTFDLFNWTGVNPTGAFAVSSPYAWDLSNLYSTGQITLTAIPEPSTVMLLILAAAGALIIRNGGRGERCRRGDFALPMGRFEGPRT
jgi:uncharacterized protein YjbI with pentapeptide repeats